MAIKNKDDWLWLVSDLRESLGNPGGGSTWDKVGWWAGYTLVVGGLNFGQVYTCLASLFMIKNCQESTCLAGGVDTICWGHTNFIQEKQVFVAFMYSVY